ncbi:MAG TPA: asparagine synthase (glutamine-hydrolyzing) [Candidatus Angelobacter sp.]|nr:asparagine synthase (glutamine-hydrolyzing) [Candidatus Angelobacter sp.]
MCGIAGFWRSRRRPDDPLATLNRMGQSLAHRGPDDSGAFFDPESGIGLSFRRLSIIDLSREGHQPMFSASGRYAIIFNGEVYNYEELRAELGARSWRGHSDTEVMLEAIEHWGLEAALGRFVGMFAFALWDCRERRLFLVRDRLGIKPIYYGWVDGDFVFASELKAIWQHPDFQGEIDRDVLAEYIRHGYVPSPHCIYRGLRKLRPGTMVELHSPAGDPVERVFWSAQEVAMKGLQSPFQGPDSEAVEQLQARLMDAVRLRMIADVPLGAFLSGGIDSSAVVALMQAQSSRPIKTYTIGFREQRYNEAAHAKKVAARLGTDHTELYVTPHDALAVIPSLSSLYDEPFADSSQIPTFLVSRLARGSVTVALSGDGGDELFGGYARYERAGLVWKTMGWMPRRLRGIAARGIASLSGSAFDRGVRLARPLLPKRLHLRNPKDTGRRVADYLAKGTKEDLYLRVISGWDAPEDLVPDSREPQNVLNSISALSGAGDFYECMMFTDLVNYLPDDVLTKVDRASMAVSLEVRVPVIDHRVVEFAWQLPLHYKIRNGVSKWALRQVLDKYVPAGLIERPKMGFGIPLGEWLRGPLREWAEELLSPAALEQHGLLRAGPIRQSWQEHVAGDKSWEFALWTVLAFQDWYSKAPRSAVISAPQALRAK